MVMLAVEITVIAYLLIKKHQIFGGYSGVKLSWRILSYIALSCNEK
jgi:hypothetical protein